MFTINPSPAPTPDLSVDSCLKGPVGANITFFSQETEMLRVAEDGFYVRGKKLEVDDKEAEDVYKAFKQFLIWAALTRN